MLTLRLVGERKISPAVSASRSALAQFLVNGPKTQGTPRVKGRFRHSNREVAMAAATVVNKGQVAGTPDVSPFRAMRLLHKTIYRGPHLFSGLPMVRLQVDLGTLETRPTNTLPGFTDELLSLLPGLGHHGCSYKAEGGLIRRMVEGTWLGHVVEHVALELQTRAGTPVTRGKTRSVKGRPGVYNVLYAYQEEGAGLLAGRLALELLETLLPAELRGIEGLEVLYK